MLRNPHSTVRTFALLLAASIVAGCAGGGRTFTPVAPATASPIAATAPGAPASTATVAKLTVTIPSASAVAKRVRKPAYVSPATQSVTIQQNGGSPQTLSLAANSSSCTASASGRTCSVTIPAIVGVNTLFKITLFASTDGSGSPLSTQSIVQTILAGQANVLSITLNGVVASLSLFLQNPTMTSGTAGSTNVVLNALDAAGAIIVGPGSYVDASGNPVTVTIADSDTSGATKLASTTATSAATIALTYSGAAATSPTISASAASLATVSTTLAIRTAGAPLTAAQVSTTLASTQSFYATLPHMDPVSDLNAVAAEMVSSGAYATATVSAGGISATLPDGSPAFIFADHAEDLSPSYTTAARKRNVPPKRRREIANDPFGNHQILFLTNLLDTKAFNIDMQNAFAEAYQNAGFAPPSHQVDSGEITLDNLVLAGQKAQLDVLDISTHGGVRTDANGYGYYTLASDTPINDETEATYSADIAANRIVPSQSLLANGTRTPTFSFTMDFVAAHVTFNPGAIFINQSCFGASSIILPTISNTLKSVGVGRYFGWTKAVGGTDADDTDAFILDRLLGEDLATPTGLSAFITQRNPAQRPFPLDDVDGILGTELRDGPLETSEQTYSESDDGFKLNLPWPPAADGTLASFVVSDFGGESVDMPIDEYMTPSIASLTIDEPSTTVTINGTFPGTSGTANIVDTAGNVHPLAVTNWTSSAITATLPASGLGSAGALSVTSASELESNAVPITQWTGRFYYHETDGIPEIAGIGGSGSGTVDVRYNIDFRADVHPTVMSIDTDPVAQNFAFNNPQSDSTATLFNYAASFQSDDGKVIIDYSLPQAPTLMTSEPPLSGGTFEFRGYAEGTQPSPCNNGAQGVEGDAGNVLCPITGWYAPLSSVVCTDSGENSGCPENTIYDVLGSYGAGFDAGGLLQMTMDPTTYQVSVAGVQTSFNGFHFGSEGQGDRNSTGSMTGNVDAPVSAPTYGLAPSARRRAGAKTSRRFVPMPTSWKIPYRSPRATVDGIGVKDAVFPKPAAHSR